MPIHKNENSTELDKTGRMEEKAGVTMEEDRNFEILLTLDVLLKIFFQDPLQRIASPLYYEMMTNKLKKKDHAYGNEWMSGIRDMV